VQEPRTTRWKSGERAEARLDSDVKRSRGRLPLGHTGLPEWACDAPLSTQPHQLVPRPEASLLVLVRPKSLNERQKYEITKYLASGGRLFVTESQDSPKVALLAALRRASCGWFTTILGPGTDAMHADHWHLDIEQHGSSASYRICQ